MLAYFRDRALVLGMATSSKTDTFYVAGSDFVAEMLEVGRYDGAVDPLSDLYLAQVAPMIAYGGRYVTCGVESQSSGYTGVERPPSETGGLISYVMLRTITILKNCFGTTGNLAGAVGRSAAGLFPVTFEPAFYGDPAGLIGRIHTSANRFGKVGLLHA